MPAEQDGVDAGHDVDAEPAIAGIRLLEPRRRCRSSRPAPARPRRRASSRPITGSQNNPRACAASRLQRPEKIPSSPVKRARAACRASRRRSRGSGRSRRSCWPSTFGAAAEPPLPQAVREDGTTASLPGVSLRLGEQPAEHRLHAPSRRRNWQWPCAPFNRSGSSAPVSVNASTW